MLVNCCSAQAMSTQEGTSLWCLEAMTIIIQRQSKSKPLLYIIYLHKRWLKARNLSIYTFTEKRESSSAYNLLVEDPEADAYWYRQVNVVHSDLPGCNICFKMINLISSLTHSPIFVKQFTMVDSRVKELVWHRMGGLFHRDSSYHIDRLLACPDWAMHLHRLGLDISIH